MYKWVKFAWERRKHPNQLVTARNTARTVNAWARSVVPLKNVALNTVASPVVQKVPRIRRAVLVPRAPVNKRHISEVLIVNEITIKTKNLTKNIKKFYSFTNLMVSKKKHCIRKKKTASPVRHCSKYDKNRQCIRRKSGSVEKRCAKYSPSKNRSRSCSKKRGPGRPRGSKNKSHHKGHPAANKGQKCVEWHNRTKSHPRKRCKKFSRAEMKAVQAKVDTLLAEVKRDQFLMPPTLAISDRPFYSTYSSSMY